MKNEKQSQRYQKKEEKAFMSLTNLEPYNLLDFKKWISKWDIF